MYLRFCFLAEGNSPMAIPKAHTPYRALRLIPSFEGLQPVHPRLSGAPDRLNWANLFPAALSGVPHRLNCPGSFPWRFRGMYTRSPQLFPLHPCRLSGVPDRHPRPVRLHSLEKPGIAQPLHTHQHQARARCTRRSSHESRLIER